MIPPLISAEEHGVKTDLRGVHLNSTACILMSSTRTERACTYRDGCGVLQGNSIQHKTSYGELVTTENWLPAGPIVVGVTSGASTPDRSVEDVLDQVLVRVQDLAEDSAPCQHSLCIRHHSSTRRCGLC